MDMLELEYVCGWPDCYKTATHRVTGKVSGVMCNGHTAGLLALYPNTTAFALDD